MARFAANPVSGLWIRPYACAGDVSRIVSSEDPLGMDGVEHLGWAGDYGVADPAVHITGAAAGLA